MGGLDDWVSWYYGRWPQHAVMSSCVALLIFGDGHPAIQLAGIALLPATVLAPAALQIAATSPATRATTTPVAQATTTPGF